MLATIPHTSSYGTRKRLKEPKDIGCTWFAGAPQRAPEYTHCHHQQSRQCHQAGAAQCEPMQHFVDGSHGPLYLWDFSHIQDASTWSLFVAREMLSLETVPPSLPQSRGRVEGQASACVPVSSNNMPEMLCCMLVLQLSEACGVPRP